MPPKKRKSSSPGLIIRPLHIQQQGQPVARVEADPNVNRESGQVFTNTPPRFARPIARLPVNPIVLPVRSHINPTIPSSNSAFVPYSVPMVLGTPPSTPKKGKGLPRRKNIANFTRNNYKILDNYLPNSLIPVAPQSQLYITP